jgi:glycosyltransferase involved in cell wall biosynthesis
MDHRKIAFIIHGLTLGGAERFFISLVNNLFKEGVGIEVILLSDKNPLYSELTNGISSTVIKRKHKFDLSVGRRVKNFLEHKGIKKIFTVNTFPYFMVKTAYLFNRETKFFVSLHSTKPRSSKEFLLNLIYFRLLNKMDTILFISKIQGDYLKKKYFIHHSLSKVVYNGIDTSFFSIPATQDAGQKDLLKKQYSIPAAEKVILSTGRLSEEKGHFYAIEALRALHITFNCKAHLVYVGAGEQKYTDSLLQFVKEQNLEGYVHFTGQHKEVRPFFCMADIFTLTSYSETFSLAALEAMSSGLPCSLTEVGGAAEMITENTGLLSISGNPGSIAETWFQLLQKQFDPRILHNYVELNFSLQKMVEGYSRVLA